MAVTAQDQQGAAQDQPSASLSPPNSRYLAVLLLVPAAALLLTLVFARTQAFLSISRRPLWHAAHYRYVMPPNQNCDVVIAGDSSGMIGVDPHAIEARTGWKTCNVGLPYMGTAIAGTRVLDDYLAHNRPPRVIVFHLSGNHLRHPRLDEDSGTVDAWLMADEHFAPEEATRLFVTHPLNTLRFVSAVWKEFLSTKPILRPDWSGASYRHDIQEQAQERGWMPERGTFKDEVCAWQADAIHTEPAYLNALVSHYTRGSTRAVVWTNPARDCDQHISDYGQNAAALGLAPSRVYDRTLFFDAFHLNTQGAERNAAALADYLKSIDR